MSGPTLAGGAALNVSYVTRARPAESAPEETTR